MKSVWFRAAAVGVAALLLTAAYKRAEPSSVMADAANAFLNSLWPDQKAKVSYAFDDDERLTWHFVPTGANYKPGDRAAVGVAALLLTAAYKRAEPSSVMADAANAFLNSLWPDQKAKVSYAFWSGQSEF